MVYFWKFTLSLETTTIVIFFIVPIRVMLYF